MARKPFAGQLMVLVQAAFAAATIAGAFALLDSRPTNQVLIGICALSGSSGSCLAPLVVGINRRERVASASGSVASAAISPLLYLVLGGVTAGTSLVLVLALLVGDVHGQVSSTGSLAFGVLVGAAVGSVASLTSFVSAGLQPQSRPLVGALSYLDNQLESRVLGRPLINYDGAVIAGWYPHTIEQQGDTGKSAGGLKDESLIDARIRVTIVPRRELERSARPPIKAYLETEDSRRFAAGSDVQWACECSGGRRCTSGAFHGLDL